MQTISAPTQSLAKYVSRRSVVAWQGELANQRFSHAVMSVLCRRQRKNPAKALPRAKVFVVLFAGGFFVLTLLSTYTVSHRRRWRKKITSQQ
jgi:hypothetical protein